MIDLPKEVKKSSQPKLSQPNQDLLQQLQELHHALRNHTLQEYKRINPFYEDLFNWKERGKYWLQDDKDVTVYNSATVIGDVTIGEKSWIGPFCLLDGTGGLSIGKYCSISTGCQILTHDTVRWSLSGGKLPYEYAPTSIGDYNFIGTHSTIVKGITIGKHCVIGAGSVVTKNVSDFSIMAGSPAQKIGEVYIEKDNVFLKYD